MSLSVERIGAIRRLLSLHSRNKIKQLLLDSGANKDRILPIPVIDDMKSKDYSSKAEILSLMFDPVYEDFDPHGAEEVLINLVKLMFINNTDFSQPKADVMTEVRNKLRADGLDFDNLITAEPVPINTQERDYKMVPSHTYDVFISHASEDKDSFVRSLAKVLHDKGLNFWYDEFSLTVGDSLRRSIDHGLAQSRFGIVVLSKHFFAKEWPQRELDGLTAREINGVKVILPVWHDVSRDDILKYSPVLADRIGVETYRGLDVVVDELLKAIKA
jgi:hypothetical protein